MSFNTSAQITTKLADVQHVSEANLTTGATSTIISDSLNAAYQEIVSRLAYRGYTQSQIDSWDRGAEFERDIALFWCLVKLGGLENADDKFIARLDRRAEIDEIIVTVGGAVVDPDVDEGPVSFGYLDTDRSEFVRSVSSSGVVTRIPW